MKLFNNQQYLSCHMMIEGYGFKHRCMGPTFLLSSDGSLTCASCGKVYKNMEDLKKMFSEGSVQEAA